MRPTNEQLIKRGEQADQVSPDARPAVDAVRADEDYKDATILEANKHFDGTYSVVVGKEGTVIELVLDSSFTIVHEEQRPDTKPPKKDKHGKREQSSRPWHRGGRAPQGGTPQAGEQQGTQGDPLPNPAGATPTEKNPTPNTPTGGSPQAPRGGAGDTSGSGKPPGAEAR